VFMYDLLLGGPGETPETLAKTLNLMKSLSPDRVGISLGVRIYPGTPIEQMLRDGRLRPAGLKGSLGTADPVYYVSPALGPDPMAMVRDVLGKDERFFLPTGDDEQHYNYNDNVVLQKAIESGYRGAYWDILRKVAQNLPA
jgi:tryptophan 2-C-methyltransferase